MAGSRCRSFGDGLTPREMRFCEEYVKDFNATQAARRANLGKEEYCNKYGAELLKKQHVRDYINQLRNRISEQCSTTVDDLMQFWTSVMLDPNESTNNRLKASDYLGKALGAFTVKVDTQIAPTIVMDLGLPPQAPAPLTIEAAVDMVMDEDEEEDYDATYTSADSE